MVHSNRVPRVPMVFCRALGCHCPLQEPGAVCRALSLWYVKLRLGGIPTLFSHNLLAHHGSSYVFVHSASHSQNVLVLIQSLAPSSPVTITASYHQNRQCWSLAVSTLFITDKTIT